MSRTSNLPIRPAPAVEQFTPIENRLFKSTRVAPLTSKQGGFGMLIDNEYSLFFPKSSDVTRQAEMGVDPELLVKPYLGGTFHLVDDQIISHRKSDYTGFTHNTNSIQELSSRVGFVKDSSGNIIARNTTSNFDHNAFDSSGGQFNVDIGFEWSAFSPSIESHFEMVRALCTNMMIFGRGTVMSRSVPIINDWHANMEISNHVLKRVFETTVSKRLSDMPHERANLSDVLLLDSQASATLASDKLDRAARTFIENLKSKLDPITSQPGIKQLSSSDHKRIATPVSAFDAFNIATEMTTHYLPTSDVSPAKLQAFSNSLIFDRKRQLNIGSDGSDSMHNTFESVDTAFFAETCH